MRSIDALIKPLPGNPMSPALATSWTESPDRLVYEFTLRERVTFHNGDPFTAEDVKFSFLALQRGICQAAARKGEGHRDPRCSSPTLRALHALARLPHRLRR